MSIKKIITSVLAGVMVVSAMAANVSATFVQVSDDVIQYVVDDKPVTGWFTHDGERYYANSDGTLVTSQWKQSTKNKTRYYFTKDGSVATGFSRINGKVYYFDKQGVMQTGWVKTKTGKRYFDTDGVMRTGWLTMKSGKKYYCAKDTGFVSVGWQKIGDYYYYFDENGVMNTKDLVVNGTTYTFESDGKCKQLTDKVSGTFTTTNSSVDIDDFVLGV